VLPTGSDAARRSVTSIPSSSPPIKNIDLPVHGSEFRVPGSEFRLLVGCLKFSI
jgi:hypothetical protein